MTFTLKIFSCPKGVHPIGFVTYGMFLLVATRVMFCLNSIYVSHEWEVIAIEVVCYLFLYHKYFGFLFVSCHFASCVFDFEVFL